MIRASAVVAALLFAAPALAQSLSLPAASPRAEVGQDVGIVRVTVDYSSPGVKDRTIWGELVPYDTLWRTGANAATTLETTGDVTIDGKTVPAGTYAMFTIPGEASWTVILNQDPTASTGSYDEGKDLLRVTVKPEEAPARERMTFLFSDTDEDSTRLDLEWAGLRVSLPIEVDTASMVSANVDGYAKGAGSGLARAARYKLENSDLEGALALIDASLALETTWFNTWMKAEILHQMEENKQAYALAKQAQELGTAAGDGFFYADRVEKALAEWKKR